MTENTFQLYNPAAQQQQQQYQLLQQENNQSFTLQQSPPTHNIDLSHVIQNRIPPSCFQQLPSQDQPQTEQSFNLLGASKHQSLSSFQDSIALKLSHQQQILSMHHHHNNLLNNQITMQQIDPSISNSKTAMIERMSDPNISAQFGSPINPASSNQTFEIGSLAKLGGFLNLNSSSTACMACGKPGDECTCRRYQLEKQNVGSNRGGGGGKGGKGEEERNTDQINSHHHNHHHYINNTIRQEQDQSSRFQQYQQQLSKQQDQQQQENIVVDRNICSQNNIQDSISQYSQQQQSQNEDDDYAQQESQLNQQAQDYKNLQSSSNQWPGCQHQFINSKQNHQRNASASQFQLSPQTTAQFHQSVLNIPKPQDDKILIRQNSNQMIQHQRAYSTSNITQPPSARSYLTQVAQLQDNQLIGTSTSVKSTIKMKRQLGDLQSKIDQLQQKLTDNTSRISEYYNKIGIKMDNQVLDSYKQIEDFSQPDYPYKRSQAQQDTRLKQQRKSQDCKLINNFFVKGAQSNNVNEVKQRRNSSIVNLHKFHQDKRSSSQIHQRPSNTINIKAGSNSTFAAGNNNDDKQRQFRIRSVDNQLGDSCQSSALSSTTNLSNIPARNSYLAQQTMIKLSQLRGLKKKAAQLTEYKRKYEKLQNQHNQMQHNFKVSQQIRKQQKGIIKDLKAQLKEFKNSQKINHAGSSLLITDHKGQNQIPNSMPASTKSSSSFLKKTVISDFRNDNKSIIGKGKTVVSKLSTSSSNNNLIKKGGGGTVPIQILVSKQKKTGKSKQSLEDSQFHDDTIDSRKLQSVQAFQPRYEYKYLNGLNNSLQQKQVDNKYNSKCCVRKQSNSINNVGIKNKKRSVSRKKKNNGVEVRANKIR